MVYSTEHGCPSHIVRCPRDLTISLKDYEILCKRNPQTERTKRVPLFGNVIVRDGKNPPLAGKEVSVEAARLADYWFKHTKDTGDILYVKFEEDSIRVLSDYDMMCLEAAGEEDVKRERVKVTSYEFRRPFSQSHYALIKTPEEIKNLHIAALEPLKGLTKSLVFSAINNPVFNSIEGVQTPDGKSWRVL